MTTFPIFEVDRDLARNLEQLGTKRKFWFRRPGESTEWLFKAEERNTGEDWAERIACELCELLGIPHVHYELAVEVPTKTPGVICPNIADAPKRLDLGNQLLSEYDETYPRDDGEKYGVRQHTIEAVANAAQKLDLPDHSFCRDLPSGVRSAVDVFCGYLMLDVLIANQDRHHQNWGAIRARQASLAPTFDHGAALARNEPEEKRKRRLYGPDPRYNVENFATKARSSLYGRETDERVLGTLDAFVAFAERCPVAASAWRERLRLVTREELESIASRVPATRMTDVARNFTVELLLINQRRILETDFS
ncbi:HipA domain-containing protein [Rhodopirellula islandica]|nr:HipA domain-containing protein [Rhodopirellula islandica]